MSPDVRRWEWSSRAEENEVSASRGLKYIVCSRAGLRER
jgi:hypothetical protein